MKQLLLTFYAPHVQCMSCVRSIERQLSAFFDHRYESFQLQKYFQYDLDNKTIQLKVWLSNDKISEHEITHILLKSFDLEAIGQEMHLIEQSYAQHQHYWGFAFCWFAGLFWMSLSLGFWVLAPWIYPLSVGVSLLMLSVLAKDFFYHAILQFKAGVNNKTTAFFNMDSLFVSTGIVVVLSTVLGLFFPLFPNLLEAGFLIFAFRHLGIVFQSYLDKKLGFSRSLIDMFQFRKYFLKVQNQKIFAKDLKPGQQILIRKGEILPIDGEIISQSPDFEIRDILDTGSYLSSYPQSGENLLAGVECLNGECVVEVRRSLDDCRLKKIDETVLEMGNIEKKAAISQQVESWLQWFIPVVFLTALFSFIIVSQFFPLAIALKCAIAVLVSACPCTLGLIIPMALRMGAYKASIHQILFQNSEALEKASKAKLFVMDYNGTLTKGELHLSDFHLSTTSIDEMKALQMIYTLEKEMLKHRPSQLLGQKILEMIEAKGGHQVLPVKCQDLGFGAEFSDDTGRYFFGNNALIAHLNLKEIETAPHRLYLIHQDMDNGSFNLLGYLDANDQLRHDAKKLVHRLLQQGKKVKICTGADEQTAQYISKVLDLSLENIQFNQRMSDKKNYLTRLKEEYPQEKIVMIGDAINDKEAFRKADVSVFLVNKNNQSDMSQTLKRSVDILSLSGSLESLAYAFEIADDTFYVIKQNLLMSFMYNFCSLMLSAGVLIALGVSMPPALGVVLMIVQSILLTLNAYRSIFFHQREETDKVLENRQALTPT
jgi:P-type Cu2+ transporter